MSADRVELIDHFLIDCVSDSRAHQCYNHTILLLIAANRREFFNVHCLSLQMLSTRMTVPCSATHIVVKPDVRGVTCCGSSGAQSSLRTGIRTNTKWWPTVTHPG